MKSVAFRGSSLDDLRAFPERARRLAGFQIDKVQRDLLPDDWKPMPAIGKGVAEIRVTDENGAFRIVYVAKFSEAIYVLHAFQKKAQQTPKIDLDLARSRYRELIGERR